MLYLFAAALFCAAFFGVLWVGFGRSKGFSFLSALEQPQPVERLRRTDVDFSPDRTGPVFAVLLFAVGAVVLKSFPVGAVLALVGWKVLPAVLRSLSLKAKREAIFRHLDSACVVLASSLRAGGTVHDAFEAAARHAKPPLKAELQQVVDAVRSGASLERAVGEFASRWPSPETKALAHATRLAVRLGGPAVPKAMLSVTVSVRERLQQGERIRSRTTRQRFSGIIVSSVPLFMLGAFRFMYPPMFSMLTSPEGRPFLYGGLAVMAAGWYLTYRFLQIEEF